MLKFAFTGPESSGKSTASLWCSDRLSAQHIEEFARAYLANSLTYSMEDLDYIALEQFKRNMQDAPLVVCDTEMLVMKIWSEEKYKKCSDQIRVLWESQEFDHYFLCKPDIPWEEDPLRENPKDRDRLFSIYENQLKELNLPYSILLGSRHQRQKRMDEVLHNFSLL
ncbi:MAG: ATP-binding protein [Crocinitomicaceae bacterium]|tara:strand:- start:4126 stop:4626 length:501 start_codon:yes stop_codon:yes gene_type:complete